MRNKLIYIALFVVVLLMTACTPAYRLEVVNFSSEPITITCKIREGGSFDDLEVSNRGSVLNETLEEDDYPTNLEKNQRIVTLDPNRVVRLESGGMNDGSDSLELDVVEIILKGVNGEVRYSGDKFYREFEGDTSGIFTIEYK